MIELIRHSCINLVTLMNAIEFKPVDVYGVNILHAFERTSSQNLGPAECVFAAGLAHSVYMHAKLVELLERSIASHEELPAKNLYEGFVSPLSSITKYLESICITRSSVDARGDAVVQSALGAAVALVDYHSRTEARRFGVKCLELGFYNASANCLTKTGLGFDKADMVKLARRIVNSALFEEATLDEETCIAPLGALWQLVNAECNVMSADHDPRVPGVSIGSLLSRRRSVPAAAALIKASNAASFDSLFADDSLNSLSDQQINLY